MKRLAAKKASGSRKTEIYVGLKPISSRKRRDLIALSNSRAVRFYEKIEAAGWLPISNVVAVKALALGSIEIEVKPVLKDRGQAHLRAVLDADDNYPFKIVFNDEGRPAVNFFTGCAISVAASKRKDARKFRVDVNSRIAEAEGVAR